MIHKNKAQHSESNPITINSNIADHSIPISKIFQTYNNLLLLLLQ